MKITFNWKSFWITAAVCLSPILLGLALWEQLPATIAIHFNFQNQPDSFASKPFAVFGLPALMVLLQGFCCFINDLNSAKHGPRPKLERVTRWIIPVLTIVLQVITLGYSLGWNIDIQKSVLLIIGTLFLVLGNYLPKMDYIKNYDIDTQKARKINRFIGFITVFMGVAALITLLLPPAFCVIWLFALIPYAIICAAYAIAVIGRK